MSELVNFMFGDDRPAVPVSKFINTSGLMLPNSQIVTVDGESTPVGYLSNSSLNLYRNCQKAFEFKYIHKEKSPPSLAMAEGSAVHKALEVILTPRVEGTKLAEEEAGIQCFRDTLNQKITTEEIEIDEDVNLGTTIDLNIGLIRQFYKTVAPTLNPVSLEEMVITHVPIRGTSGGIKMVLFIDMIDNTEKGKSVIDFKTGRVSKNLNDVVTDAQLTLYSMATKIPQVGFMSLKKGTLGKAGGVSEKTGRPLKGRPGNPPEISRVEIRKTIKDYENLTEDISTAAKSISAGYFDRTGRGTWMCTKKFCPHFTKCMGL